MRSSKFTFILIGLLILLGVYAFYTTYQMKKMFCRKNDLNKENQILADSLHLLKKQIDSLHDEIYDMGLFRLKFDAEGLDYLDENYGERADWEKYITDKLMESNLTKGDNPLIPHAGMYGDMKINSVRVLNQKWLIVNFSDGKIWGEALFEYEPVSKDSIRFKKIRSLLYPFSP